MKKINKPGDNLGGLLKLWAVPVSDCYVDASGIHIIGTSNIYELYCSPDSMDFSEISNKTDSGLSYDTVISGFIPQDNPTVQEYLFYILPRKWSIIFIDGNGSYKIAGNSSYPLRFSYELKTGKDTSSLAGFTFQFFGKTKTPSAFINNPF